MMEGKQRKDGHIGVSHERCGLTQRCQHIENATWSRQKDRTAETVQKAKGLWLDGGFKKESGKKEGAGRCSLQTCAVLW